MFTYKQHSSSDLDLTFGAENRDEVGSSLLVGEADFRVGLRLDVVNEDALLAEKSPVVLARDCDSLVDVVLILQDSR